MTPDRRRTGARFDGRPISKGQFPTMTRRNGLRTAGASLLMAGLIATGVGVTAPEVVSAPVQTALQWAGPNVGHGTESSINWAGYGVSGGTFTKVAGSWVQPGVTCPAKLSEGAAFWVGIDGLVSTDKTVEQIGTDSDCVAASGPSYYAWYQMYPKESSRPAPFEVSGRGGRDHRCAGFGDGQGLHTDDQCHVGWRAEMARHNQNDRHHGAEGIVRRVDSRSPLRRIFVQEGDPLSDFGSVNFSGLSVVGRATNPKAGFTDTEITMTTTDSASVKAYPSALSSGGTAFGVTWVHN